MACVCVGQLDVEVDKCICRLNRNVKRSITYLPVTINQLKLINNKLRVTCIQHQPLNDMLIEKLTSIKLYYETIWRNKQCFNWINSFKTSWTHTSLAKINQNSRSLCLINCKRFDSIDKQSGVKINIHQRNLINRKKKIWK